MCSFAAERTFMSTRCYTGNDEREYETHNSRQRDEIELILAAYTREEVWLEISNDSRLHDDLQHADGEKQLSDGDVHGRRRRNYPTLVRALRIQYQHDDVVDRSCPLMTGAGVELELRLHLPPLYPKDEALRVQSLSVVSQLLSHDVASGGNNAAQQRSNSQRLLTKRAYEVIPELAKCCRDKAQSSLGAESIWTVLTAVEDWMEENRHRFFQVSSDQHHRQASRERCSDDAGGAQTATLEGDANDGASTLLVGRRLFYSHHIIAKSKRADLASLFRELDLTGYVKVGWPGVILIEGTEESCIQFFEAIRRWSWKHLAVRGVMRETAESLSHGHNHQFRRLLPPYSEVDDLFIISRRCHKVGLDPLFRTLFKGKGAAANKDEEGGNVTSEGDQERLHGALLHVDHMNDGRSYRKRIRKMCRQLDVCVAILEVVMGAFKVPTPTNATVSSTTGAHRIVAALVGVESGVQGVLKKWRTSHVDVDSRGRPCRERMLTVLDESPIALSKSLDRLDWESLSAEESVRISLEDASAIVSSIGGRRWVESLAALFSKP